MPNDLPCTTTSSAASARNPWRTVDDAVEQPAPRMHQPRPGTAMPRLPGYDNRTVSQLPSGKWQLAQTLLFSDSLSGLNGRRGREWVGYTCPSKYVCPGAPRLDPLSGKRLATSITSSTTSERLSPPPLSLSDPVASSRSARPSGPAPAVVGSIIAPVVQAIVQPLKPFKHKEISLLRPELHQPQETGPCRNSTTSGDTSASHEPLAAKVPVALVSRAMIENRSDTFTANIIHEGPTQGVRVFKDALVARHDTTTGGWKKAEWLVAMADDDADLLYRLWRRARVDAHGL